MLSSKSKSPRAELAPWRKSVRRFAFGATSALIVNFIFTITAIKLMKPLDETGRHDGGLPLVGVLLENRSCDEVKRINTAIHILINALSAILLAGSNYCMQVLAAPSREQVDEAHRRGRWLDIGVPSLRNMFKMKGGFKRVTLWLLLALSSVPLHLFYNSAVFASLSVNEYNVTAVEPIAMSTQDIDDLPERYGEYFAQYGSQRFRTIRRAALDGRLLVRMNAMDCIKAYASDWQSSWGELLVVGERAKRRYLHRNKPDTRFGIYTVGRVWGDDDCEVQQAYLWMCLDRAYDAYCEKDFLIDLPGYEGFEGRCDDRIDAHRKADALDQLWPLGLDIDECHGLRTTERCRLMFSPMLMVVVMSMNLLKGLLMLVTASEMIIKSSQGSSLLTIGDAISSFLSRPDETTKGMCLASRKDVTRSKKRWEKLKRPKALYISGWKSKFATAGALQWWCAILYYLGTLAVCLFTFFWGYAQIRGVVDRSIIFSLGLGAVSGKTFVNFSNPHHTQQESVEANSSSATLIRNVVIANAPQIFASMIYFTYNSLVTSLSLAAK